MLAAVMPLVNAATASMPQTRQAFHRRLAFNLFGQGVASFETAQLLIRDRRPIEALPALRNLVMIASRFEQMTDENGPGIGIALRMALDTLQETSGLEEASAIHRERLLSSAASVGIHVPAEPPAADDSKIHNSLRIEMQLAESTVKGNYTAAWLHLKHEDDYANFYTQMEPGPITELIASACVIALLDLLVSAAKIFCWAISQEEIQTLIAEARELNDASANP